MIRFWDVTVFTKNRQRLLAGDSADAFFAAVLQQARSRDLLSDEHFTVDGNLLEAWAGQKSFRRVGWMKSIGLLRRLRHRGLERVGWMFNFVATAYNLVRMRNLIRSVPQPQVA
jgi:hypothetical protein